MEHKMVFIINVNVLALFRILFFVFMFFLLTFALDEEIN